MEDEPEIPKTRAQRIAENSKDIADFLVSMEERVTNAENIPDAVAVEICAAIRGLAERIDQRDEVLKQAFAVIQTENVELRERVAALEAVGAANDATVKEAFNEVDERLGAVEAVKSMVEQLGTGVSELRDYVKGIFGNPRPPSKKKPPKPPHVN